MFFFGRLFLSGALKMRCRQGFRDTKNKNEQHPMSNTMMPWSVKGVSDEARARAKSLAQSNGQTMGVWLSELILSLEAEEEAAAHTAPSVTVGPQQPGSDAAVAELAELMLALARRVATLEKDTAEFAASFQDQLSDLRYRLRRTEQAHAIPALVTSSFLTEETVN
jgi:hypothetical protein